MKELTIEEQNFCIFIAMEHKLGSFTHALLTTIFKADTENSFRLGLGYPEYVKLTKSYLQGIDKDYWLRVKAIWNEQVPTNKIS